MDKIKSSILSYGLSGKVFHAPFLEVHTKFILHSIVERSKKIAKDKYPNIISYSSVEEAYNCNDIDLIIVNTPNYTHFEYCKKALVAGKHVLVEKPFCLNIEEATELFKLADEKKLQLLVFQNRRFDSEFLSLKEVIDSKVLGNIVEAHFRFDRYRLEIGNKIAKEGNLPGAGIKYDLGSHLVDMAIALFGLPKSWRSYTKNTRPNSVVDDYMNIILEYENGETVFLTASMLVAKSQKAFVINGSKGSFIKERINIQEKQLTDAYSTLEKDFGKEKAGDEGKLYTFNKNGELIEELIESPKSSYSAVFDHVYNTIIHNKEYFISRSELLKQIEILSTK